MVSSWMAEGDWVGLEGSFGAEVSGILKSNSLSRGRGKYGYFSPPCHKRGCQFCLLVGRDGMYEVGFVEVLTLRMIQWNLSWATATGQ